MGSTIRGMGETKHRWSVDKKNPGNARIGGSIRNHKGHFVAPFAKNIGIATNNKAEIWVLTATTKHSSWTQND